MVKGKGSRALTVHPGGSSPGRAPGCPTHLGGARSPRQQADQPTVAHRHPRPLSPPEASLSGEWGSELRRRHMEQRLKSVEWSTLPLVGTSSSGGTDSGSSSGQLAARCRVRKVTGRPPRSPGCKSSEPTEAHSRSFSRDMQTQTEGGVGLPHDPPPPPQGHNLGPKPYTASPNSLTFTAAQGEAAGASPVSLLGPGGSRVMLAAAEAPSWEYHPLPPVLGVIPLLPSASRVPPSLLLWIGPPELFSPVHPQRAAGQSGLA